MYSGGRSVAGHQKALRNQSLEHFDGIGRHPNVELLKLSFQTFFEFHEEPSVLRQIGYVDEDSNEVVPKDLALMLPEPADDLCFGRDCAKVFAQLQQRRCEELIWDWLAAVKLPRQEDFETSEGIADSRPALPR
jgi:hypothetical protein